MIWQPVKAFKGCYGIPTAKMTRDQWVAARTQAGKYGLGGSEIGALLPGADLRFNSPIRMFYQRIGLWEDKYRDNKYAFMGRFMEQQVINLWQHWAGDWGATMAAVDAGRRSRKSRHCNYILKNPEFPFLFANIDNQIVKSPDAPHGKGILECKTMSGHASDRYETGIPPKYVAQMQHYMIVTGQEYAELAVLKDGVDFEVYPLRASEPIQIMIVSAAEAFMHLVTEARKELAKLPATATLEEKMQIAQAFEPQVSDGDDEYDFLSEKAKAKASKQVLDIPADMWELYVNLRKRVAQTKENEAAAQELKNKIRQRMIADDVYQYRYDNKAIVVNGNRFLVK
jgi:predicted phage-related endonuclease